MNSPDLILPALVGLAVLLSMVVLSRAGSARRQRAAAAAAVAEVGTSPFSLLGRVLITAGVIVGVQWFVITRHADNTTLLWVVLAVPALITAVTLGAAAHSDRGQPAIAPEQGAAMSGGQHKRPEDAPGDAGDYAEGAAGEVVDAELLSDVEGEYVDRWLAHDRAKRVAGRLGERRGAAAPTAPVVDPAAPAAGCGCRRGCRRRR